TASSRPWRTGKNSRNIPRIRRSSTITSNAARHGSRSSAGGRRHEPTTEYRASGHHIRSSTSSSPAGGNRYSVGACTSCTGKSASGEGAGRKFPGRLEGPLPATSVTRIGRPERGHGRSMGGLAARLPGRSEDRPLLRHAPGEGASPRRGHVAGRSPSARVKRYRAHVRARKTVERHPGARTVRRVVPPVDLAIYGSKYACRVCQAPAQAWPVG